MISIKVKGDFKNTEKFFKNAKRKNFSTVLKRYGELGVSLLSAYTPKDTGKTSDSWSYEIIKTNSVYKLYFTNSNTNNGIPIAILIQYGHATKNGGYIMGRDYINPALRPVFEEMAEDLWKEVTMV